MLGEGEWERRERFKESIFRKLLTLCTWTILSVFLEGAWAEGFDHDRWSQKCTKISERYLGRMFKIIAK